MVFYRTLLAAIGMAVLIVIVKGKFALPSRRNFFILMFTGLIVAIHWLLFFGSARVSNPSVCLVGLATNSFWAALLEPFINKKKIHPLEIGLGIAVLVGLYIIFSFNFNYPLGLTLGIAAGFFGATFGIINSKLVARIPSYTITFYEMIAAFIGVTLFLPFYQKYISNGELQFSASLNDWIFIAILSIVCTVYAYSQMVELSKKFSVFFIQLALNLEPVYGIILALIIFGKQEVMSASFYVGTIIILSAVILYPALKRKYDYHFNSPAQ